jgi:hypothetical protein
VKLSALGFEDIRPSVVRLDDMLTVIFPKRVGRFASLSSTLSSLRSRAMSQ